jgi:predicted HNH restriction endonuclease
MNIEEEDNILTFYLDKSLPIKFRRDHISNYERYNILKKANWKCSICGNRVKMHWYTQMPGTCAEIHHIHPIKEASTYDGYINELKNFQVLCYDCHKDIHSKK